MQKITIEYQQTDNGLQSQWQIAPDLNLSDLHLAVIELELYLRELGALYFKEELGVKITFGEALRLKVPKEPMPADFGYILKSDQGGVQEGFQIEGGEEAYQKARKAHLRKMDELKAHKIVGHKQISLADYYGNVSDFYKNAIPNPDKF